MGKTHRLMRASKNKQQGRGLNRFLKSIRKNGRWRGHAFDLSNYLKGETIDVKPKKRHQNRPEPYPNRKP